MQRCVAQEAGECLSVLIDQRGVRVNCHHCGWSTGIFYDEHGDRREHQCRDPQAAKTPNDNGRRAIELWKASGPLLGSPGIGYLGSRKIGELPPRVGEALRFHTSCPLNGAFVPCIIALFRDVITNKPKAIHRIAIDGSGKWSLGPKSGCAIKLSADDEVEQGLTIGEGVETTLAAWQHGFRPTWACGDAANISDFPILAGIAELTIVVDNDLAGHKAARTCSARWTAAGHDVFRIIPNAPGADFNDVIKEMAP
jgi:hypothetical protein